jgi:hypothetical protein
MNGGTTTFDYWRANSGTPGSYNPIDADKPKFAVSLCGTDVDIDVNDRSGGVVWRLPNIAELGQMSAAASGGARENPAGFSRFLLFMIFFIYLCCPKQ